MANITPIPDAVQRLYDHIHNTRTKNLMGYKNDKYSMTEGGFYQIKTL